MPAADLPRDPRARPGRFLRPAAIRADRSERSGELCVQRDLGDGSERLGDGAAHLRSLGGLLKRRRSTPGTTPRTRRATLVIPSPGTNVTVAEVSRRSGGVPPVRGRVTTPSRNRPSGLLRSAPPGSSCRWVLRCAQAQLTSSAPKAPLPAGAIVPAPSISEPCQVVVMVRSVAICTGPSRGDR